MNLVWMHANKNKYVEAGTSPGVDLQGDCFSTQSRARVIKNNEGVTLGNIIFVTF